MPTISKPTLKSYFETGDVPTQANFAELIDSCYNLPGGLSVHRFIPDVMTSSVQIFYNQTIFNTNGAIQWFNLVVFIPPAANSIRTIQLVGQAFRSYLQQLRLWHFSDVSDSNLNPFQEYPGYWHNLYSSPVALPLGTTPQNFSVQIPLNKELKYNNYRYFLLQMAIRTLTATNTDPAGSLTLKPFGLEYE